MVVLKAGPWKEGIKEVSECHMGWGILGPVATGGSPEWAEQNLTAWTLPTAPERSRAAGEPQFGGPGEGCGEQGSGAATVLLG